MKRVQRVTPPLANAMTSTAYGDSTPVRHQKLGSCLTSSSPGLMRYRPAMTTIAPSTPAARRARRSTYTPSGKATSLCASAALGRAVPSMTIVRNPRVTSVRRGLRRVIGSGSGTRRTGTPRESRARQRWPTAPRVGEFPVLDRRPTPATTRRRRLSPERSS